MKDPTGNRLVPGFVDVVKKQDAGFYSYLWPKPGLKQQSLQDGVSAFVAGVRAA